MRRCLACGVMLRLTVVHHCPGASAVNIMDRANDTKIDKYETKVLEWGDILYSFTGHGVQSSSQVWWTTSKGIYWVEARRTIAN